PEAVITRSRESGVRSQEPGRSRDPEAGVAHAGGVVSARPSPTEERSRSSANLDRMPLRAAIRLMLGEDSKIPKKLLGEMGHIEQVVRAIARAFKRGGRLFYVGAGTSGRLGVLDASECPPTFRTPPQMVQAIIAGG